MCLIPVWKEAELTWSPTLNLSLTLALARPRYPLEQGLGGEFVGEQLPRILTGHKTKTQNKSKDVQSGVRQSAPNKQKGLMLEGGGGS